MKAAVYHGTRDLRIDFAPEPDEPGPDEMILEVLRAAICGTDVSEYLHGPHFVPLRQRHPGGGHVGPTILGHEFVGRVISMGSQVDAFELGQRVVPGAGAWCGQCEWCRSGRTILCERYYTLGLNAHGGLAEYVAVPARMCRPVPDGCSDVGAAMAQPLAVALHTVSRSGAVPGQAIALQGMGGIGSFILAAAVAEGLGPVIALDIDDARLERASALGAADVIDARAEDPIAGILERTRGAGVPVYIEASGAPSGPATALKAARRGGRVLLVGLQAEPRALDLHEPIIRELEIVTTVAHVCDEDLPRALEILAAGSLAEQALDRVIELDALVEEGILALADGRARGKVIVDPRD